MWRDQTKELLFSVRQFHQCGKKEKVSTLFQQQPGALMDKLVGFYIIDQQKSAL